MILYQENEIIIRTIESRDKKEILNMFRKENFGFVGLLADERPSIIDEMKVIDKVLSKEEIAEEYIILEQEGIIITYASIFHDSKDTIHIGTMITKKEYRSYGYGTKLLNFIKEYANQNNLKIKTETLNCGNLLINNGFIKIKNNIKYIYEPFKKNKITSNIPVFLDYEGQLLINKENEQKDLENYKKTLDFLKNIGF